MAYDLQSQNEALAPGVIEAVRRYPWCAALFTAAGLALAIAVTVVVLPPRYEATAELIMSDPQQPVFSEQGALPADFERFLNSAADFVDTPVVMDAAAEQLGDDTTGDDLAGFVAVSADPNERTLEISAEGGIADLATDRANAIATAFAEAHEAHLATQADAAISAVQGQIGAAEIAAQAAQDALAANPTDVSLRVRLEAAVGRLSTLQDRVAEIAANASAFGSGVELVDEANVPDGPASPNLRVNAGIGLLAGALAGLTVAWFLADRRRPVISSDEPAVVVGAALLGKVGGLAHDDRALHDPAGMPAVAYQFVASALMPMLEGNGGVVVLVAGAASRAGTSTTAANIAVAVARDNRTVTLVDACPDEALAGLFGVAAREQGLLDVFELDDAAVDRTRLTWALRPVPVDGRSVRFVSLGTTDRASAVSKMRSPHMHTVLEDLRQRFDVVVIDAGPLLDSPIASALERWIDALVLVVRRGTDGDLIAAARSHLALAKTPVAGYVFTFAEARERLRFRESSGGGPLVGVGERPVAAPATPARPLALPPASRLLDAGTNGTRRPSSSSAPPLVQN